MVTTILLLLFIQLWDGAYSSVKSQQPLVLQEPGQVTLRDAVFSDIEDMVSVLMDAFASGPAARYTHPGYKLYENYTKYCAAETIKGQWKNGFSNHTMPKVITIAGDQDDSDLNRQQQDKVVAVAVWQLQGSQYQDLNVWSSGLRFLEGALAFPSSISSTKEAKYDCSLRLGVNVTRSDDFARQLGEIDEKYITSKFKNHLYLAVLATHPTWDGHGFAAMNLAWGKELAKKKDLPITLIGTPAGYPLYKSEGFQNLKNATIKKLDNEGEMWYEVMKYDAA